MTRPFLVAYVIGPWTMVRGVEAKRVLTLLGTEPRWSSNWRGWVVHGTEVCHDLQAYANSIGQFIAISHRRPK